MISDYQLDCAAFDLWLCAEGEDNRAELDRVKRIVPIVLAEVCTENQRKYIERFFIDRMSQKEIADFYGVNPSTVSRTIHRGLDRAYSYLRFASPLFIKAPQKRSVLSKRRRMG